MSTYYDAKQDVLKLLKQGFEKKYSPSIDEIECPVESKMGDFAFPCFLVSKGMKKPPQEIAAETAAKLAPKGFIKKIEAKGPYINFFLDPKFFGQTLLEEILTKGSSYGSSTFGKEKRVMVEYASLNTHKETHIGHLRNIFIGQVLTYLLRITGHQVIASTYIGDLGTHVSRCLWGLRTFYGDVEIPKKKRNVFFGEVYAKAVQSLETQEGAKKEIDAISSEVEAKKGEMFALWKKTRKLSLDEMKRLFQELAIPLDVWYFESDVTKSSKQIIQALQKKGIATQSQGAMIVNLENEQLGINLLLKSDGTLLYNGRDIGLAVKKEKEYHPDRSLYVVDTRQSLAMNQLFATLKRMGFEEELEHISYEFVTLKDGAMSSRQGNVIRYEDFRDQMVQLAQEETQKRHTDWSEKQLQQTARIIAFAAMRFGMLRQDLDKKIVFDMQEAMAFDGFTGPYLLYTLARIRSLLRKASQKEKKGDSARLTTPTEHDLLISLAHYPEMIFSCAQDYRLARLPQYLFDLAKTFSRFYESTPILQAQDESLISARLYLVLAVAQVLENGLALLGIETVEEM